MGSIPSSNREAFSEREIELKIHGLEIALTCRRSEDRVTLIIGTDRNAE